MKKALTLLIALFTTNVVHGAWTEATRSTSDSTVTLTSVTVRVREIVDDSRSSTGSVRYSSATIYNLINTAQKIFCINTRALSTYASMTLTAGTTDYLLPSNCLYFEQITMDIGEGDGPKIMPQKTVFQLGREDATWTVDKSSPTAYYIRNRSIGFYPAPEYSGAIIAIWYIKYPATMTNGSDYIFDGYTTLEPYSEAIADYAAYQILLLEGKHAFLPYLSQNFIDNVKLASEVTRYNPDYLPSFSIPASPSHK